MILKRWSFLLLFNRLKNVIFGAESKIDLAVLFAPLPVFGYAVSLAFEYGKQVFFQYPTDFIDLNINIVAQNTFLVICIVVLIILLSLGVEKIMNEIKYIYQTSKKAGFLKSIKSYFYIEDDFLLFDPKTEEDKTLEELVDEGEIAFIDIETGETKILKESLDYNRFITNQNEIVEVTAMEIIDDRLHLAITTKQMHLTKSISTIKYWSNVKISSLLIIFVPLFIVNMFNEYIKVNNNEYILIMVGICSFLTFYICVTAYRARIYSIFLSCLLIFTVSFAFITSYSLSAFKSQRFVITQEEQSYLVIKEYKDNYLVAPIHIDRQLVEKRFLIISTKSENEPISISNIRIGQIETVPAGSITPAD